MMDRLQYQFLTGFANPEDLVPVPDTQWLIASGMGDPDKGEPGGLYAIDRTSREVHRLWPSGNGMIARDGAYDDFASPVSPAAFMTHGICLETRPDGRDRLYAVNHGERESIEIFDLRVAGGAVKLDWVGGIAVPYPSHGNAVARLADGTVLMSCIYRLDDPDFGARIGRGEKTGYLLSWRKSRGWMKIAGSEASCPNGLIASEDGETLFTANTGSRTVTRSKLDPHKASVSGHVSVDLGFAPDNLRWNEDGSICAAGFASLSDPAPRACRIDPRTLEITHFALPPHTADFEYVATAVMVDRELWLSVYQGDKVAVIPLQ